MQHKKKIFSGQSEDQVGMLSHTFPHVASRLRRSATMAARRVRVASRQRQSDTMTARRLLDYQRANAATPPDEEPDKFTRWKDIFEDIQGLVKKMLVIVSTWLERILSCIWSSLVGFLELSVILVALAMPIVPLLTRAMITNNDQPIGELFEPGRAMGST